VSARFGDGRKRFLRRVQDFRPRARSTRAQIRTGLRLSSRRIAPESRSRRAILIGAFLTAISPLMAQSGRVRIRVTDVTGAVVPGSVASLLGEDGKPIQTAYSNETGEIEFADLPMGNSRFVVQRSGFKSLPLTVTVRSGDEIKVQAQLEVNVIVGEVVPCVPSATGGKSSANSAAPRRWRQIQAVLFPDM
jgi:hypothetical protein